MVSVTNRRFTVDEYELMIEKGILTENDRVELIRGEIVEKMVIGPSHIACVNRLTNLLVSRLNGQTIVSVQNPIRLADSEPEPDLALLVPRDDFYASKKPTASDVQLVIEVSDSSLAYDQQIKLPLYAQAGIQECWIMNLEAGHVEVYRQPLVEGRYEVRADYSRPNSLRSLAFPAFEFAIAAMLGN